MLLNSVKLFNSRQLDNEKHSYEMLKFDSLQNYSKLINVMYT